MNDKDTKIFSYLKLKFLIPLRKPPVESFFVRIEISFRIGTFIFYGHA